MLPPPITIKRPQIENDFFASQNPVGISYNSSLSVEEQNLIRKSSFSPPVSVFRSKAGYLLNTSRFLKSNCSFPVLSLVALMATGVNSAGDSVAQCNTDTKECSGTISTTLNDVSRSRTSVSWSIASNTHIDTDYNGVKIRRTGAVSLSMATRTSVKTKQGVGISLVGFQGVTFNQTVNVGAITSSCETRTSCSANPNSVGIFAVTRRNATLNLLGLVSVSGHKDGSSRALHVRSNGSNGNINISSKGHINAGFAPNSGVTSGFARGIEITAIGRTNVTISANTISAVDNAIHTVVPSGSISISLSGAISSTKRRAIYAYSRAGNVSVVTNSSVRGADTALLVKAISGSLYLNTKSGVTDTGSSSSAVAVLASALLLTGTQSVTISSSGNITSNKGSGVNLEVTSSASPVSVSVAGISANKTALYVKNTSVSGNITVTATNTLSTSFDSNSNSGIALRIVNEPPNGVSANSNVNVQLASVSGTKGGVSISSITTGTVTLSSSGMIRASRAGLESVYAIDVLSSGSIDLTVNSAYSKRTAIRTVGNGSGSTVILVNGEVKIDGANSLIGISVKGASNNHGDITVTVGNSGHVKASTNKVVGFNFSGLYVNNQGSGSSTVVVSGKVTTSGNHHGYAIRGYTVDARAASASVNVSITKSTALVSGTKAIWAGGDNDTSVNISNSGTIVGEVIGIYAKTGSGAISIETNGNITASGNSGTAIRTKNEGVTNITLNSGANVGTAGGTGKAIVTNGEHSKANVTVNKGAVITGSVDLGPNKDTLVFQGGTTSGAVTFNGGAGHDRISFSGDTFSSRLVNWEEISIGSTATVSLRGNSLTTTHLTLDGTLSLQDNDTDDLLNITGNLSGNGSGVIRIDVNFVTKTADQVVISGASSGNFKIRLSDLTPLGSTHRVDSNIRVITLNGIAPNTSAFTLENSAFVAGGYKYTLTVTSGKYIELQSVLATPRCAESSSNVGVFTCSGAIIVPANMTKKGTTNIVATLDDSATVNVHSGIAISISGENGVRFTQEPRGGTLYAGTHATGVVQAKTTGTGNVSISTVGAVTLASSGTAIRAESTGTGNIAVSAGDVSANHASGNAIKVQGFGSLLTVSTNGVSAGRNAIVAKLTSNSGRVSINTSGLVSALNGRGIDAYIKSGSVTIKANAVNAVNNAIHSVIPAGSISISSSGAISSTKRRAIYAYSKSGSVSVVTNSSVRGVDTSLVMKTISGSLYLNAKSGVTDTGSSSSAVAILASAFLLTGTQSVTVSSGGDIRISKGSGVSLEVTSSASPVSVSLAGISANKTALYVKNTSISGNVTVTATNTLSTSFNSNSNRGIALRIVNTPQNGVSANSNVNVQLVSVLGTKGGVSISSTTTGTVTFSSTGIIRANRIDSSAYAVDVLSSGSINLTINSAYSKRGAIRTVGSGSGSTEILVNGVVKTDGTHSLKSVNARGTSNNHGDIKVTVGSSGHVIANSNRNNTTQIRGVYLKNQGIGSSTVVVSGKVTTSGNNKGYAVSNYSYAIHAVAASSSVNVRVTQSTALVSGKRAIAANGSGQTSVNISNSGTIVGELMGIFASTDSGAISITTNGNVTASGNKGNAINTENEGDTNITINSGATVGTRGKGPAILVQSLGTGNITVSSKGHIYAGFVPNGSGGQNMARGIETIVKTQANVTITGNTISAVDNAIRSVIPAGAISIKLTGAISSTKQRAIYAYSKSGNVSVVTNSSVRGVDTALLVKAKSGSLYLNAKSGVTDTGSSSSAVAILASALLLTGTQSVTVSSGGDITINKGSGVSLVVTSSASPVSVSVAGINANKTALYVKNTSISGNVTVTATSTLSTSFDSNSNSGIALRIVNEPPNGVSANSNVNVQLASVSGTKGGVSILSKTTGTVTLSSSGMLNTSRADSIVYAVDVLSSGSINLTVNSAYSKRGAIRTVGNGTGSTEILVTGEVKIAGDRSLRGVEAKGTSNSHGDIKVTIGSSGHVNASTNRVQANLFGGVYLKNQGSGSSTVIVSGKVTTSGNKHGYALRGYAIQAKAASSSVNVSITSSTAIVSGTKAIGAQGSNQTRVNLTNSGTIVGEVIGIYASTGSGAISITTNGNVTASGSSGTAIKTANAGVSNVTLNSGATVGTTGGIGKAIVTTGEQSRANVTVNTGAVLTASVDLGPNGDTLDFQGGATSGTVTLDGGAGNDRISFSGNNIVAARLVNWEEVSIGSTATVSVRGGSLSTSSLELNGTISLHDNDTNDRLNVTGNLSGKGSGIIYVDVNFATKTADQVVFSGTSSGNFKIRLNDLTSAVTAHRVDSNIRIITLNGTSPNVSAFSLENTAFVAGGYRYTVTVTSGKYIELQAAIAPFCAELNAGTFICSGSTLVQQSLVKTGATNIVATLEKSATIEVQSGTAFFISGENGISFTQQTGGGALRGGSGAIGVVHAKTTGNGNVIVSTVGEVSLAGSGTAIKVESTGTGNVTVSAGNVSAIHASGNALNVQGVGSSLAVSANTVSAGLNAIFAKLTSVAGSLSINTSGAVTASSGRGIYAYIKSGTIEINTTSSVTGNSKAIEARANGAGNISISISGNVTASPENGNTAIDTITNGGSTAIKIHNGTITAGGNAIRNDHGNSDVILYSGAVISGNISLGGGDDILTFNGATSNSDAIFSGGTNSDDSPENDTIVFNAGSTAWDGTKFTLWENIKIGKPGTLTFNNKTTISGISLILDGKASLKDDAIGDELVIGGNLSGPTASSGGIFYVDVNFESGLADTITVGGNVTGKHVIRLNNITPENATTVLTSPITVFSVKGSVTRSAISVESGFTGVGTGIFQLKFNASSKTFDLVARRGLTECVESAIVPGEFRCGGTISASEYMIKSSNTNISTTLDSSATVNVQSDIAFYLSGKGNLSFTQEANGNQIIGSGSSTGLVHAHALANGSITISLTGTTSLTSSATAINATTDGTGDITISTASVTASHASGTAIYAKANGGNIAISATTIVGGEAGIVARNNGTSGAVSIFTSQTISSSEGIGIDVLNSGQGNIVISATDNISSKMHGIKAVSINSGNISITTSGTITSNESANSNGILAHIRGKNSNGDIIINANNILASDQAIDASHDGSGSITINLSGNVSATNTGISATTESGDISIRTLGNTQGRKRGLYVATGNGDISISTAGKITGGSEEGIDVYQKGSGDVSIQSKGVIESSRHGIRLRSRGNNNINIEAQVDGGLNGVQILNQTGNIVLKTSSSSIEGKKHGIELWHGSRGNVSISTQGEVTGENGAGIYAHTNRNASSNISVSVAGAVSGGDYGVYVYKRQGAGGVSVNILNGVSVAGGNYGIFIDNYGSGEIVASSSGAVNSEVGEGVVAFNTGSTTKLSFTNVSAYDRGIYSHHSGEGDNIIVTKSGGLVSGREGVGIYATGGGSGNITISAYGRVEGRVLGIAVRSQSFKSDETLANGCCSANKVTKITATEVSSRSDGIHVRSLDHNNVVINVENVAGGKTSTGFGYGHGIRVIQKGEGSVDISTNSSGIVSSHGNNRHGIYVQFDNGKHLNSRISAQQSSNQQVSITARGEIRGGTSGIKIGEVGGGLISISANALIHNISKHGIHLDGKSVDDIDLSIALSGQNGIATSGGNVIYAIDRGIGDLTISVSANKNSFKTTNSQHALVAKNYNGGSLVLDVKGDFIPAELGGDAINLRNFATQGSIIVTVSGDIENGNHGIRAFQAGDGNLTISSTGHIKGKKNTGVWAKSTGRGDIVLLLSDIEGGKDALYAAKSGSGSIQISVNGDVKGSTAGIVTKTQSGQQTRINVNSGARIRSSDGNAITNNVGNSIINVAQGASIEGDITLGDGVDSLIFNGAESDGRKKMFLRSVKIDGGAGNDTLRFDSGKFLDLNASKFLNWETIQVWNGATIEFSGDQTLNSNLHFSGGTLDLSNDRATDALTVAGAFTTDTNKGLDLLIDVDFARGEADTLTVTGDLTGKISISVNSLSISINGSNQIKLIEVRGQNTATVSLATKVVNRGIEYELQRFDDSDSSNGGTELRLVPLNESAKSRSPIYSALVTSRVSTASALAVNKSKTLKLFDNSLGTIEGNFYQIQNNSSLLHSNGIGFETGWYGANKSFINFHWNNVEVRNVNVDYPSVMQQIGASFGRDARLSDEIKLTTYLQAGKTFILDHESDYFRFGNEVTYESDELSGYLSANMYRETNSALLNVFNENCDTADTRTLRKVCESEISSELAFGISYRPNEKTRFFFRGRRTAALEDDLVHDQLSTGISFNW